MHKAQHHFFQLAFGHLAVAYSNARPGHQFLQLGCDFVDAFYSIVDEVHLTAAFEFLLQSGLDQLFIPGSDHGLNGDSVFRRGLDDAHVA